MNHDLAKNQLLPLNSPSTSWPAKVQLQRQEAVGPFLPFDLAIGSLDNELVLQADVAALAHIQRHLNGGEPHLEKRLANVWTQLRGFFSCLMFHPLRRL